MFLYRIFNIIAHMLKQAGTIMTKHTIQFDVSAQVTQEIIILDDNYTITDIVSGLNKGELVTTIAHDGEETKKYITDGTLDSQIAEICTQTSEGEYEDFTEIEE